LEKTSDTVKCPLSVPTSFSNELPDMVVNSDKVLVFKKRLHFSTQKRQDLDLLTD